jgi:hypothetical protein
VWGRAENASPATARLRAVFEGLAPVFYRVFFSVLLALGVAAPASAEPALWKVQGLHATVYLFGTVHVLKSTTQWRTPKIDLAFASSGTLWEEVASTDDQAALQPLVAQYGLDTAHPLSSQLDDASKAKLATFEATYGLAPARVDLLRPWLVAMMISVLPMTKVGYDSKSGVDIVLRTLAKTDGKPLMGFETAEQQVHYLADLPQKQQLDYLALTLAHVDESASGIGALVDAWAAGDTVKLDSLMRGDEFTGNAPLYQTLIVQRNRAFASKIEDLLKGEGTTFVAIGAGHLVGPDSVQAALAKDGIQAVRQ